MAHLSPFMSAEKNPPLLPSVLQDNSYSFMLRIPPEGLELKTRIFVEVKASNLTNRFPLPYFKPK